MTNCPACQCESPSLLRCMCGLLRCPSCYAAHSCPDNVPPLWPPQERAIAAALEAQGQGYRSITTSIPTGGGKSRVAVELMRIAKERGKRCALFTHRRIITRQARDQMVGHGLEFGMFAAGYPPALGEWCIIASVQTASSRGGKFALPDANWVFVDEIHNQAFRWVIEHYRQRGSIVFGFTATPVDLAGVCDKLIVAGTNSELRSCGALVRCKVFSPEQPDLDGVRRLRNREYDPIELRRRFEIVKWEVFANAFKEWRRLNPDEKPTLLWAPGVEESLWFVEQFIGRDVRAEHIDGETPDEKREEIFEGSRSGRIPIVSSCGVLREGVDLPWVVHGILVQVCGRLSTYLQIVGRLLRAYPGKELAILQDHAGAFWRHGSPNQDRDWQLDDTDAKIDQRVSKARREGKIAEPIRCPRCGMERLRGPQCPHCGYKHQRGAREIRMIDGQLKRVTGNLVKCMKQVTPEQRVWTSCLYAAAYSKNGMTLRQAAGLYKQRTGEWPPQGLKNMPEPDSLDWNRAVKHVYPWLTNRKRRTSSGE